MPVFLPQARFQVPRNALLDLTPINEAIDAQRRNALLEQQQEMQREELGMRRQEFAMRQRQFDEQQQQAIRKRFGSLAQMVDTETDPNRRRQMWDNVLRLHPNAASLDPAYRDPIQGPRLLMAEAGIVRDPLEEQEKRARLGLIQAQTEEARAKAKHAGLPQAPSGYRWSADGTRLEAIPGGPATHIAADVSGRLAMIETARRDLPKARQIFTQPWGVTGMVSQAILPEAVSEFSAQVGQARRTITSAIEAALRAMTGAAAPESEVQRYEDLFMPKATDPPQVVQQKLDALDRFLTNAVEIATRGRRTEEPSQAPQQTTRPRLRFNPDTQELEPIE